MQVVLHILDRTVIKQKSLVVEKNFFFTSVIIIILVMCIYTLQTTGKRHIWRVNFLFHYYRHSNLLLWLLYDTTPPSLSLSHVITKWLCITFSLSCYLIRRIYTQYTRKSGTWCDNSNFNNIISTGTNVN